MIFAILIFLCPIGQDPVEDDRNSATQIDLFKKPVAPLWPDHRTARTHAEEYEALDDELRTRRYSQHPFLPLHIANAAWDFQNEDGSFPFRARFSSDHWLFNLAIRSELVSADTYHWLERFALSQPEPLHMWTSLSMFFSIKCEFETATNEDAHFMRLAALRKYLIACNADSKFLESNTTKYNSLKGQGRIGEDIAWLNVLKSYRKNAESAWKITVDQILAGTPICEVVLPLPAE